MLWNAALCTWHGSCMHELSSILLIYKNSHKINPINKYRNQWETALNVTSLSKVLLIHATEEGSLFFWIWSSIGYQHPSGWSHIYAHRTNTNWSVGYFLNEVVSLVKMCLMIFKESWMESNGIWWRYRLYIHECLEGLYLHCVNIN